MTRFDEEPDGDPHGECLVEITRLRNERDHALDDLKAEIANHREDLAALEAMQETAKESSRVHALMHNRIMELEKDLAKMTAWRDAAHRDRETEEQACLKALAERDCYHEWADQLADAIGRHFVEEIGEHSSSNNPWKNALELIENR